jgi:MFS family permease
MVFSLLATEVAPERRSTTLNLVYLPLYISGIIGPAIGGGMAAVAGPAAPFVVGGIVFLLGATVIAVRGRSDAGAATPPETPRKPEHESRGVPLG